MSYLSSLLPYVKNVQIFSCPSVRPTPPYTYGTSNIVQTSAYLMNHSCVLNDTYNSLSLGNVDAAKFVMMTEYKDYHTAFFGYATGVSWPSTHCLFPHNDGQNIVFCDGHAKWESKANLMKPGTLYNDLGLMIK